MYSRELILAVLLSVGCGASEDSTVSPAELDDRSQLTNLAGTWRDPAPYAYGEAFGAREFTFDEGKWTLRFTLSLDPAGELPVFDFRTKGRYEVGAAAKGVDGAFEAVFHEEQKFLTLRTSDSKLAQAFGFTPCGLTPNVEKDISTSGCSAWKPVAQCPSDYDLLALVDEGRLAFGVRPADNDMCSPDKRPTALTAPVHKI
jgi:hypothetical protein